MNSSPRKMDRILKAGFTVIETNPIESGPSVSSTWQLVSAMDATPEIEIPYSNGYTAVTEKWTEIIRSWQIPSVHDTLLISVPTQYESDSPGWINVSLSNRIDLSHFATSEGSIEFVSRSIDGTIYCGVTGEDSTHWIVAGEYPAGPKRLTWIESANWPTGDQVTITDVLQVIRENPSIPRAKIAVAKILHEIYGLSISDARIVTSELDDNLMPSSRVANRTLFGS